MQLVMRETLDKQNEEIQAMRDELTAKSCKNVGPNAANPISGVAGASVQVVFRNTETNALRTGIQNLIDEAFQS